MKGIEPYLSTCISPCPVDSLSSGRSPTGVDVFSRALLTLYGLTGIPSACRYMKEFQKLKCAEQTGKETDVAEGKIMSKKKPSSHLEVTQLLHMQKEMTLMFHS